MPQIDIDGAASRLSADNIRGQSGSTITIVSGHSLSGSGSGLTALPAANLTGTISAISGANLTNLNATQLTSGTLPMARLSGTLFELITHESTVKTSGIQLDFGDVSVTTSGQNGHATVTFNTAFSAIWAVSITGVSRISSTRCFTYSRSHSTTTLDVSVFNDYDSSNRTYELNWLVIGAKA